MLYQEEVVGLSMVTETLVILFNAGLNEFHQVDEVGADLLFFLSVYLITSIILAENKRELVFLRRFIIGKIVFI